MIQSNENRSVNRVLVFVLILLSLLLNACTNKEQSNPKTAAINELPKGSTTMEDSSWKVPLTIPKGEGEFDKVVGWLSDGELIYVTNLDQTSNVFVYNLLTGKSELLYHAENPIVNVQISPAKTNILIHSAPSSYEGLVAIIDRKGNELLKKSFPSYELVFEWNPYNESEVLVSKFAEDWSFQLFLVDISHDSTREISLPQPFIKWINADEVAFLGWDDSNPSLAAPLIIKGITNEVEKTVSPAAIHFSTFHNLLMKISVDEQDLTLANYAFFDSQLKELFAFSIPQLTKFSDWLVPFYDYNEQQGQFITFSPLTSGEADSYTGSFNLLAYDLKKGSSKLVMEGLENEPVSYSPTGKVVLYGNRFEKIIDIKAEKIYELMKE